MGASVLRPRWLVPPELQAWQRSALLHLRRHVPPSRDVIWLFSSGTQSVNSIKCVALSFEALKVSAEAVNRHLLATAKDRWSIEIPSYHIGGFSILTRAEATGSRVFVHGRWKPVQFCALVKRDRITLTSLVPTQVFDLVAAELPAPKSLRAVVVGGGALDPHLYLRARKLGWPLLPSYGLTECASQVATAALNSLERQEFPGLTVLPHARVDLRLQRLFVQCQSVCRWVATATADGQFTLEDPVRDGWLATEDLGEWKGVALAGREPQLHVLGRQDDVVKVLGVLVSLAQVESDFREFCRHNSVVLSCDWAISAVEAGRQGAQIYLLCDGQQGPLTAAVHSYNSKVSGPQRIQFVTEIKKIPRTALGKLKKAELRAHLANASK